MVGFTIFDLYMYRGGGYGGCGSVGELSLSERYLELLGPLETSTSVFGML